MIPFLLLLRLGAEQKLSRMRLFLAQQIVRDLVRFAGHNQIADRLWCAESAQERALWERMARKSKSERFAAGCPSIAIKALFCPTARVLVNMAVVTKCPAIDDLTGQQRNW
jgi:hypothetical protein